MAKFSLVPFVILSMLSITISSCKDDEEESTPTPEIQQQLKKLVGVKSYNENNELSSTTTFYYDNFGRVYSIKGDFNYDFVYNGNSATMVQHHEANELYGIEAYDTDYVCQIGSNGSFTNYTCDQENQLLQLTWNYEGEHCTSYRNANEFMHSEGNSFFNYTYDFVWENDDMVSSKMTYESSPYPTIESTIDYTYSNQNGEMLENKGLIGINLFELGGMRFEPGILHGYNSKHLPISYIETYKNGATYQYTLDWVLNEEGYPEKVTSGSGSFTEFIWE